LQVLDERDIVVTKPANDFKVTYRRDAKSPVLVAVDAMEERLSPPILKFLIEAWKLAYHRAKSLGWLGA
jgi:hypothetical protein